MTSNFSSSLLALAKSHAVNSTPVQLLIDFVMKNHPTTAARYWAVVDFSLRSSHPRLFIFDLVDEEVTAYLVAHGIGSEGKTDDGYANIFSNTPGSNCSSLGVYKCAESYYGKHDLSCRIDGLESTNSNVRNRDVVIHGAAYVSQAEINATGRIGRSDGCFAVDIQFHETVVNQLKNGSYLIAWHP